jgi:hypothetical protein
MGATGYIDETRPGECALSDVIDGHASFFDA